MLIIYITLLFLIALFSISKPGTILNNNSNAKILSIIIICIVSIDVIFREHIHDTKIYIHSFEASIGKSLGHLISVLPYDFFWILFQWIVSKFTTSPYIFLAIIWFIFLFGLLHLLKKLFSPWQLFFVLFTYTAFVFFYSYATMALRQGVAISFLLLAISLLITNKEINAKVIISLITSSLFHWSSIPFALVTILVLKNRFRIRFLLILWCIFATMFVFGIQNIIISPFANLVPNISVYTSSVVINNYTGINRLDFLLFSALWIAYSIVFYLYYYKDETYKKLIKLYISYNSLFLLFGFVAYSDRIAGYSWMLIPIIVWYPLLKKEKYSKGFVMVVLLGVVLVSFLSGTFNHYLLTL